MLTGLNIENFSYPKTRANAISSARMFLSSPASYMSSADPAVFGRSEVVVKDAATGVEYTPADYRRFFTDAHLPDALQIANYYIGFVKFRQPADFPDVDVSAERGSGIPTVVGAVLPNLTVGQIVDGQDQAADARWGRESGRHDEHGHPRLEGDALLPVQPHRQSGRRPLLAAQQQERPEQFAGSAGPAAIGLFRLTRRAT